MFKSSSFKEAFAHRGSVVEQSPAKNGIDVNFALSRSETRPVNAARCVDFLASLGMPLTKAYDAVLSIKKGETIYIDFNNVSMENFPDQLYAQFNEFGINAVYRSIPEKVNISSIRNKLGLTQEQFAAKFSFPTKSIIKWEKGRTKIPDSAKILFLVIERNPELVENVISSARLEK